MSAKAVKTLTVSGLGTYDILEAQLLSGAQVEDIEVTSFADTQKAFVPHPQAELTEMSFKTSHGSGRPTLGAASVTVAGTWDDGTAYTNTIAGYIKSATPATIQVGGDRVAAWDVTFRPSGGGATSTTTTGA
jgi:hypothetical protein